MTQTEFKTLLIKWLGLLRIVFSRRPFRERLYEFYLFLGIRFVRVKIRGNKMWLDLKDRVLARHYFLHRGYESFEVSLIEEATKQSMTFVDVGACIGYHTLIGSRCVGDSGSVVALEPAPSNYSLLMRNIRANGIPNVHAVNAAAMDYQGTIELYLSRRNFGDHRVYDAKDEQKFNEGGRRERISVPCVRVDDVLEDYGLEANVIKIDVQGAELDVLRGAAKILEDTEYIILEVSLFQSMIDVPQLFAVLNFMKGKGFVAYDIISFSYRPIDQALSQVDMAFVKEDGMFQKEQRYCTPEQRKEQNRRFKERHRKRLTI